MTIPRIPITRPIFTPPSDEDRATAHRRRRRIVVYVNDHEHELFTRAARRDARTLADWIRESLRQLAS